MFSEVSYWPSLIALQMSAVHCHPSCSHSLRHVKTDSHTGHGQKRTIHLFLETSEALEQIPVLTSIFMKTSLLWVTFELECFDTENVHCSEYQATCWGKFQFSSVSTINHIFNLPSSFSRILYSHKLWMFLRYNRRCFLKNVTFARASWPWLWPLICLHYSPGVSFSYTGLPNLAFAGL